MLDRLLGLVVGADADAVGLLLLHELVEERGGLVRLGGGLEEEGLGALGVEAADCGGFCGFCEVAGWMDKTDGVRDGALGCLCSPLIGALAVSINRLTTYPASWRGGRGGPWRTAWLEGVRGTCWLVAVMGWTRHENGQSGQGSACDVHVNSKVHALNPTSCRVRSVKPCSKPTKTRGIASTTNHRRTEVELSLEQLLHTHGRNSHQRTGGCLCGIVRGIESAQSRSVASKQQRPEGETYRDSTPLVPARTRSRQHAFVRGRSPPPAQFRLNIN